MPRECKTRVSLDNYSIHSYAKRSAVKVDRGSDTVKLDEVEHRQEYLATGGKRQNWVEGSDHIKMKQSLLYSTDCYDDDDDVDSNSGDSE